MALGGQQGFLKSSQEIQAAQRWGQTLNSYNVLASLCESDHRWEGASSGRLSVGHLLQLFQMRTEVNDLAQESLLDPEPCSEFTPSPLLAFHTFLNGHICFHRPLLPTLTTLLNSRLWGVTRVMNCETFRPKRPSVTQALHLSDLVNVIWTYQVIKL